MSTFRGKIVLKPHTTNMLKHTKIAEGTHQRLVGGYIFCNRVADTENSKIKRLIGEVITTIFACLRSATIREVPELHYLIPHISKDQHNDDYPFCNLLACIVPACIEIVDGEHHQSNWALSPQNLEQARKVFDSDEKFCPTWCPSVLAHCQNRAVALEVDAQADTQHQQLAKFYGTLSSEWKATPTLHLHLPEENCTVVSIDHQLVKFQRANGSGFYACCYMFPGFCDFKLEVPTVKGKLSRTIKRHEHSFVDCFCNAKLPRVKGKKLGLLQGPCLKCRNYQSTVQHKLVQQDLSLKAEAENAQNLQYQLAELQKKSRALQKEKLCLLQLVNAAQVAAGFSCQESSRRSVRVKSNPPPPLKRVRKGFTLSSPHTHTQNPHTQAAKRKKLLWS